MYRILAFLSGPVWHFVKSNYKVTAFGSLIVLMILLQMEITRRDRIISQQLSELASVKRNLARCHHSLDSLSIVSYTERDSLQNELYEANRDRQMMKVWLDDFKQTQYKPNYQR